jgi:DNA-binding GntR family transcriptional regulator
MNRNSPVLADIPLTDRLSQRRSDQQAIFETLRRRISTNAYPPGTALKEVELAAEFGVSRTPIRQVLQRLEYGGLVQPVVGHGTIVSGLDLPRMREVIQFRIQLALILRNFLDLTDVKATLERLAALRKRQDRLKDAADPVEFAEISHEIRDCIHSHISNRYMAETWQNSYFIASRLWFGGLETSGARFVELQSEELDAITRAFASKDPAVLGDTVHDTLTRWVEAVSDAMRLA